MKITSTLFLAAVLSGLSIYYFFLAQPSKDIGTDPNPAEILSLSGQDAVSWLEIQNELSKEKVALRREGKEWHVEFPVAYPAEEFLVEGMLKTLSLGRRLRRIPFDRRDGKELGFDPPEMRIGVETEKGAGRRVLLIGADSPVKGRAYAHWEGESEYFLVPSEVKAALGISLYSLREKKLFYLRGSKLDWIHVKAGGNEFRIKKENEKWYWEVPQLAFEIPLEKISDLIYAFEFLYVKEFLDGKNPDQKEFELSKKDSFLALGPKEGAGQKVILGGRAKGKDAFYAVRENEKLVILISEGNLKALLETFEVVYQELQDGDPGKSEGASGKGLESSPTGGTGPV